MVLGSTQPLVKMNTRDVLGGKGGRCVRLTAYHHTVPMSRNLGPLTLLDPSGPAWPLMGVLYLYLYVEILLYFIRATCNVVIRATCNFVSLSAALQHSVNFLLTYNKHKTSFVLPLLLPLSSKNLLHFS
jgi:hypothetical protein